MPRALRDLVLASVKAKAAEEGEPAALSRRRRSGARSRRRTRRTRLYRRHADDLPDGRRSPACRARPATPSPPTGSRRCCIIRGAARAPSWRRRAPPASKSRRWRSRNAAFPTASPPCVRDAGATPGHGGGIAGRKCLVRGAGPCFALRIALRRPAESGNRTRLSIREPPRWPMTGPKRSEPPPDSGRAKRAPPTIDLEATEVSETRTAAATPRRNIRRKARPRHRSERASAAHRPQARRRPLTAISPWVSRGCPARCAPRW